MTTNTPLILSLLTAFGLLVVHNLVHYLSFASHYRPYVEYLVQASALFGLLRESAQTQGVTALLVATALLAVLLVARRPRPWGVAAVAVLVAYGVNYAATTDSRLDETIVWLSWYVSWPVLGLAALRLVHAGRGGGRAWTRLRGPTPRCRRPALSLRSVGDGRADPVDAAIRAGRAPAYDAPCLADRGRPAGAGGRATPGVG